MFKPAWIVDFYHEQTQLRSVAYSVSLNYRYQYKANLLLYFRGIIPVLSKRLSKYSDSETFTQLYLLKQVLIIIAAKCWVTKGVPESVRLHWPLDVRCSDLIFHRMNCGNYEEPPETTNLDLKFW